MVTISQRVEFLKAYLSPKGREELAAAVQAFRAEYGDKWLAEFKAVNGELAMTIDLIANHDFEEAVQKLKDQADRWIDEEPAETFIDRAKRLGMRAFASASIEEQRPSILELYTAVRVEIDRPRF